MVKIGHARSSETGGKYGVAGDQTGNEVSITDWYNGEWLEVYRPKDKVKAECIASFVEKCCYNDFIGYSQNDRLTLYYGVISVGGDPNNINFAVNCDCSSLVTCACLNAGIDVSPDMTTAIEHKILVNTGEFEVLKEKKYLQSFDYLKRGDILRKSGHTAVVLTNGDKVEEATVTSKVVSSNYPCNYKDYNIAGSYTTKEECNMREYPSLDGVVLAVLGKGTKVRNYGYYNVDSRNIKWLFVQYKQNNYIYQGYISEKVVKKNE